MNTTSVQSLDRGRKATWRTVSGVNITSDHRFPQLHFPEEASATV